MRSLIILSCLYLLPVIFGNDEKNDTTFVPTHEWQLVKKGTPIPKGLHVRHNFETGITEAKLMDNEEVKEKDDSANSLTLHPEKAILEDESPPELKEKPKLFNYPQEELKARLKKIKQDAAETPPELNDEHAKKVKQKFRDYETLKKELKDLEINITTDSELLTTYFQKFQNHKNAIATGSLEPVEIEEILDILYNLEYLLHHIDTAKVFADMQGMGKIVSPCLNGTNNEIKAEALRLLGAAVQSNPRVQLKALENDLVQMLLHILSTNTQTEMKSRSLFALSALIRQFPAAQKVWLDHGGFEIFESILMGEDKQLIIQVMRLVNDLIVERQHLHEGENNEQSQMKRKAYAVVDLKQKLSKNYCNYLISLTIRSGHLDLDQADAKGSKIHEFLRTLHESMITIIPLCKKEITTKSSALLDSLRHLMKAYQERNSTLDRDSDIVENLTQLIEKVRTTVLESIHDEL